MVVTTVTTTTLVAIEAMAEVSVHIREINLRTIGMITTIYEDITITAVGIRIYGGITQKIIYWMMGWTTVISVNLVARIQIIAVTTSPTIA